MKYKDKNKGHTREFKSDDPTSFLSHPEQQKAMLLDTIDDAKPKPKKRIVEPIEIPEIISVPRYRRASKLLGHAPMEVLKKHYIEPTVGLSRGFTQDRIREGQILKELDKEMATERKNSSATNEEDK